MRSDQKRQLSGTPCKCRRSCVQGSTWREHNNWHFFQEILNDAGAKMNARRLALVGASCSCLAFSCLADDQQSSYPSGRAGGQAGSAITATPLQEWVANLETAGIVNRTRPGPRIAVPLMSFEGSGTTLSATYASMPGGTSKGVHVFVRIPLR